jgi:hypothetical protein
LQTYLNNHNENNNKPVNSDNKINQQVGSNTKTPTIDDAINELNKLSNFPLNNRLHILTKKSP